MCHRDMKIIFMSSVMIMNITILNIHMVNGRWVQAIIKCKPFKNPKVKNKNKNKNNFIS